LQLLYPVTLLYFISLSSLRCPFVSVLSANIQSDLAALSACHTKACGVYSNWFTKGQHQQG